MWVAVIAYFLIGIYLTEIAMEGLKRIYTKTYQIVAARLILYVTSVPMFVILHIVMWFCGEEENEE